MMLGWLEFETYPRRTIELTELTWIWDAWIVTSWIHALIIAAQRITWTIWQGQLTYEYRFLEWL